MADHKFSTPGGIATSKFPDHFHVLRKKEGAVTSDSAPFDTAHFPKADVAVNCTGFETIFVRVDFTDGGSGTVKVTPRVLDPEDGLWFRLTDKDGTVIETPDISAGADKCFELRVCGRASVLFQLTISGTVEDLTVYGIGGQRAER